MTGRSVPPRVWGLLGHRTGDNNQLLALCEELGLPFETRCLSYNRLRVLEGYHLVPSLASLLPQARRWLQPPWPDLLITIGRRSVPIARAIKKRNRGRTRLVLIGHPRTDPSDFDLVITTRQYPPPKHRNVLVTSMAMSRSRQAPEPDPTEAAWLDRLPRPHLLFAIGGSTKYFDLDPAAMAGIARDLAARAQAAGGTLIVAGSPRTDRTLLAVVEANLAAPHQLVRGRSPRFPVLMADADQIFVTGDSLSMLSEAILTGRPVGMVEPAMNASGRRWLGDVDGAGLGRGTRRDLRRVWEDLKQRGLVGTVDAPIAGKVESTTSAAAEAVRHLLGG